MSARDFPLIDESSFPGESWDQLVEFEIHLKSLERFFNLENHPARSSGPITFQDNLAGEVALAERQFRRVMRLGQGILNESDANALVFRSYIENEWVSDSARDALLSGYSDQKTWRDSLFLLLEGLQSLANLAAGVRSSSHVSLTTFRALGQQLRSLMISNRFFNPFRAKPIHLFVERLNHPILRRAVLECPTIPFRRALGLVLSVLMRHIRVLGWINTKSDDRDELLDAVSLLGLLHSEFGILRPYLEKSFPNRFFPLGTPSQMGDEFRSRVDSFSFELQIEARKVFESFLLDYTQVKNVRKLRGSLEAAHGLLSILLEQAVMTMVGIVIPGVSDKDVFPASMVRYQESLRLREDLWLFSEVLKFITEGISGPWKPEEKRLAYRGLLDFLTYFENLSYQLVRYWDREPFEHFCREMRALREESFNDEARCQDVAGNFECFRVFIVTILGLVNQRASLRVQPLDEVRARRALRQFLRCA